MTTTCDRRRVAMKLAIPADISFLAWSGLRGCLFDPRPMLTKTANDHAAAWQEMLTSHSGNPPRGPAPVSVFRTRSSTTAGMSVVGQSALERRLGELPPELTGRGAACDPH